MVQWHVDGFDWSSEEGGRCSRLRLVVRSGGASFEMSDLKETKGICQLLWLDRVCGWSILAI